MKTNRRVFVISTFVILAASAAVPQELITEDVPAVDFRFDAAQVALQSASINTLPLAADVGPEFVPSSTQVLSFALASKKDQNALTVTLQPFRLLKPNTTNGKNDRRWMWGFGVLGSYQSDVGVTTFGTSVFDQSAV